MARSGAAHYRDALRNRARELNIPLATVMNAPELEVAIKEQELDNAAAGVNGLFWQRVLDRIADGTLDSRLDEIKKAIQDRDQARQPIVRPIGKTRTVPGSSE